MKSALKIEKRLPLGAALAALDFSPLLPAYERDEIESIATQ